NREWLNGLDSVECRKVGLQLGQRFLEEIKLGKSPFAFPLEVQVERGDSGFVVFDGRVERVVPGSEERILLSRQTVDDCGEAIDHSRLNGGQQPFDFGGAVVVGGTELCLVKFEFPLFVEAD